MQRFWVLLGILVATLSGCRDRMTCPEYQSRFILDDDYRQTFFAYFDADTLPIYDPDEKPRRTWYGTVEKKGYLQRKREMETVPMEMVFAPKVDTTEVTFEASDFVNTTDSTFTPPAVADSTIVVAGQGNDPVDISSTNRDNSGPQYALVSTTQEGEKTYNVEQSLYMYYVGAEVMKKREEAYRAFLKEEAIRQEEQRIKDSTREARRQRFRDFFKFNKKEEAAVEEPEYDPFLDYTEEEEARFGNLPNNNTPAPNPAPQDPALPDEEEEETPDESKEEGEEPAEGEGGGNRP